MYEYSLAPAHNVAHLTFEIRWAQCCLKVFIAGERCEVVIRGIYQSASSREDS